jgi:hypothetical protein
MSHSPDPEMRRGGPPQATPDIAKSQRQKLYHVSPVLIATLAPLCVVLLILAIGGRL